MDVLIRGDCGVVPAFIVALKVCPWKVCPWGGTCIPLQALAATSDQMCLAF